MAPIVAGRSCQGCTLCCKVLAISALEKPRGIWCTHCDRKRGCKIHGDHPDECRDFYCGYLTNAAVAEHWRPTRSKLVLAYDDKHAPRLSVHVDPDRANAWREEPYYSQIRRWATAAATTRAQVIVWAGRKAIAVLPDREKDLGEVRADQFILTLQQIGPRGPMLDVIVVNGDDPRALAIKSAAASP